MPSSEGMAEAALDTKDPKAKAVNPKAMPSISPTQGKSLLGILIAIIKDNIAWSSQIRSLALFDLRKLSRGAVLGWAWFFVRPAIYIFCFWFALDVGLRAGSGGGDGSAPPYMLWLSAGIIPWFFIMDMLGRGVDVLHRYPYLVNKIKFPLSGISSIYTCSAFIIHLLLLVPLFVIYFACGMKLDVYLLQIPILMVLSFVFWDIFSMGLSQLSAISKDFANLMKALGTPFFWLSGVIFDATKIHIGWVQTILTYNPITFFVNAYRDAFYNKVWFWDDPQKCIGFAVVFVLQTLFTLWIYRRFNEEVADVL